jgi:YegS/Rv2252/BmrU family lipid kinase
MTKRIKLIANPVAGKGARQKIETAATCLNNAGCEVDLTVTRARGEAEKAATAARNGNYQRILAAGGDGTLNEVVNGLVPCAIPLGFLPLGTTNVLALELGIPFDVEKACHLFLHEEARPVHIGAADDRRFILMASAGRDAEAVYRVSLLLKRWTGKLAYVFSGLRALTRGRPGSVILVLENGEEVQGDTVIVSNGKLYGGRFFIAPEADLEEAAFVICVFKNLGWRTLIKNLLWLVRGKGLAADDMQRFKTTSVVLRGENIPVQIDGDYCGKLPMRFRSCPDELRLIMPAPKNHSASPAGRR